ncbi:MAG TPA: energy-coupling factor ABC transporter permease [Burkholderiaceae bacterium]|nr:energy-coupling factor ABC transporter permease [Burkholderiaceae bacterium]
MLAALLVVVAAAVALAFRPFAVLRAGELRAPWLASLAIVALAWIAPNALPGGPSLRLSFACLLVLMFGWPLALWTLLIVAAIVAALSGAGPAGAIELAAWHGVVPASFGLAAGVAVRRWLPPQIFVYILGRAFFGTLVAAVATGALATLLRPLPPGTTASTLMLGYWLTAWGEAIITGMLTAIFVAYRPQWLFTWSDRRYLPRPPAGR